MIKRFFADVAESNSWPVFWLNVVFLAVLIALSIWTIAIGSAWLVVLYVAAFAGNFFSFVNGMRLDLARKRLREIYEVGERF